MVALAYEQAVGLVPSQVAAQAPKPGQAARPPCGKSPVSVVQVPSEPATSQAWHWPLHAWSQQKPSVTVRALRIVITRRAWTELRLAHSTRAIRASGAGDCRATTTTKGTHTIRGRADLILRGGAGALAITESRERGHAGRATARAALLGVAWVSAGVRVGAVARANTRGIAVGVACLARQDRRASNRRADALLVTRLALVVAGGIAAHAVNTEGGALTCGRARRAQGQRRHAHTTGAVLVHCAIAIEAQPFLQIVPVVSQPFGAWHACCCAGEQVPVPVQDAGSVATSFVQLASRHDVPAPGNTHDSRFLPSHCPAQAVY